VCDGLNLDLILVADIVTKLSLVRNELSNDMPDIVDVDVNVTAINTAAAVDDAVGTDQDDVNDMNDVLNGDDVDNLIDDDNDDATQSTRTANTQQIIQEQHEDRSLANCWSLAERAKAGYFARDGILYRKEKILGQEFEQLCLPKTRRAEAIKLAHQVDGGHLAAKKTKERLKFSFTWPTIAADVTQACQVCDECQKRKRVTVYDRIPITPVTCKEKLFNSWVMDCLGPLFPNEAKYNYCVVLCDRVSRFPVAFCLSSLNAKCVCNALLQLFQMTGIPSVCRRISWEPLEESWRGLENADPRPGIMDLLQRVGRAGYVCLLAITDACWQITAYPDPQWLTNLVWDPGGSSLSRLGPDDS